MIDGLIPYLKLVSLDTLLHLFDNLIALLHFAVDRFIETDHMIRPLFCQRQAEVQKFHNISGIPLLIRADQIRKRGIQHNACVFQLPWLQKPLVYDIEKLS